MILYLTENFESLILVGISNCNLNLFFTESAIFSVFVFITQLNFQRGRTQTKWICERGEDYLFWFFGKHILTYICTYIFILQMCCCLWHPKLAIINDLGVSRYSHFREAPLRMCLQLRVQHAQQKHATIHTCSHAKNKMPKHVKMSTH